MAKHLPSLLEFPTLLWGNRWLVLNFFRREMLSRFHGSMLGAAWVLLRPLFQFAIYFLVFGYLFGRAEVGQENPEVSFALYLFSGIVFFSSMNEAIGKCVTMVATNGNLVKKVAFPSQVLPVPICMTAVVVYLVGAALCLVVGWSTGVLTPSFRLLALPLVLVLWFCFMLGFGMILATLQVFARDVQQLWTLITMAWFFASPVFWPPEFLLHRMEVLGFSTWPAELWYFINPAFSLLMSSRMALGAPEANGITMWGQIGVAAIWATVYLVIGYSLFMSRRLKFADEV